MQKVILAFDLGGTYLKYGLGSINGDIIYHTRRDSKGKGSFDEIINAFKAASAEMLEYANKNDMKVIAASVGTPGAVNTETGAVIGSSPNIPAIVGISFKKLLEEELGMPVAVENDANLATLGEAVKGAGEGRRSVLGLTLGTGLGGGFIYEGKIFRGENGSALEIGHSTIDYKGRICSCGKPGHIEAYSSGSAIINRANELEIEMQVSNPRKYKKTNIIFTDAGKGYQPAKIAVQEGVDALAVFLANMINILDPSCIVIGGGVMFGYQDYWEEVERKTAERAVDSLAGKTHIIPAKLGNMAGMVGAVLNAVYISNT